MILLLLFFGITLFSTCDIIDEEDPPADVPPLSLFVSKPPIEPGGEICPNGGVQIDKALTLTATKLLIQMK